MTGTHRYSSTAGVAVLALLFGCTDALTRELSDESSLSRAEQANPGNNPGKSAETNVTGRAVSCSFPRGMCGYVDNAGRILIQPDYDWAEAFDGNLARIKSSGMYGVIDLFGRPIVPAKWDYISRFENSRAVVMTSGRYGVLDQIGREILQAKYAKVIPTGDDIFLVDTGSIDPTIDGGRLEAEEGRPVPARPMQGRWGLIAAPDTWVIPPRYGAVRPFSEDTAGGSFWAKPSHKWQLISSRGNLLTGAVFDQVETATGGVAVVRTANQWNAVDSSGNSLLPADVQVVKRRPDGLVSYQIQGRIGVIGRDGAVNVPASFDQVGTFVGDRALAIRDGIEIWVNGKGEAGAPSRSPEQQSSTVEPAARTVRKAFRGSVMACADGLSLKLRSGRWTFVDRKWRQAIDGTYDAARCFVRGVAWVVRAGSAEWIRIDRKGATVAAAPSCRLPDYESDPAGTVGRPPACNPVAAAQSRGGGP